jgi:DNA-directed RNA polymerase specialized sigma24 family protein
MVELLREWGAGKARDSLLEHEILALGPEVRRVIYGVYLDKLTYNEIGEEMQTPTRTIINRHERAIHILADRLVTSGTYMEGLGSAKCGRRNLK